MSVTFLDGPAQAQTLTLQRAPLLLRVTQGMDGKWDALDQPRDQARADELVYVYILAEKASSPYHVYSKRRGHTGWRVDAVYKLYTGPVPLPPEPELHLNDTWAGWCDTNRDALIPEWGRSGTWTNAYGEKFRVDGVARAGAGGSEVKFSDLAWAYLDDETMALGRVNGENLVDIMAIVKPFPGMLFRWHVRTDATGEALVDGLAQSAAEARRDAEAVVRRELAKVPT